MGKQKIRIKVNGADMEADVESRLLLVHCIRDVFGLTGTHIGCDTTHCGACTVHLDGKPIKSCTLFAVQADGCEIKTVEGLEQDGKLHPGSRGILAGAWIAVRLLHAGYDDDQRGSFKREAEP